MHLFKYVIAFQILLLLSYSSADAQLKIPGLFSDNMVLQQKSTPPIWGWGKPHSTVKITTSWSKEKLESTVADDGKWSIHIATPKAGGPYRITISLEKNTIQLKNIMIGEVWLCTGQSNMEMPMKGFRDQPVLNSREAIVHSKNPYLRFIKIPRSSQTEPKDSAKYAVWQEANPATVANFSATGYYFGRLLQQMLDSIPIGLINISYGGSKVEAWMDPSTLNNFKDIAIPQKDDSIKSVNQTPTVLFNGMLHPVIGYGIKGCIWYQGESNYENPDQYEKLFPAMVNRWRTLWQQGDFPFYFVQIAPFDYTSLPPYHAGGKYNSAFLRDAQRKSLQSIPNAAMVSLMDIGEEKSIHPIHKQEGGDRLAYIALNKLYGLNYPLECPTCDSMQITGNTVTIKFRNAPNGLTSYGKPLQQFEIAGKDKTFFPAQAVIYQGKIKVSATNVPNPVAVRYAFRDFIVGELFNTEGLPVSSFRTDDWDD
ncbi:MULTISPECIES: sialate O-acetylesterase [Chitinophagaceae]